MPYRPATRTRYARSLATLLLLGTTPAAFAALQTFNSPGTDIDATRDAWLLASGITSAQHAVDFETGFSDGQNVSGLGGLFPGGLVITDTSSAGSARIEGTAGGIGGSNPVGGFALEHNERAYLALDFSAAPIDYLAFRDIDHTGTQVVVTFVGCSTTTTSFEGTAVRNDSAEFFGLFRNDMPRITRIEMDAGGDGAWAIDNLEYGVSTVPLPGAAWLFGGAFGVLLAKRRRG